MKLTYRYLLLLLLPITVVAKEIPDFSANYQVQINGMQAGELRQSLTSKENGIRRLSSVTQAKGIFSFFKPDVIEESSLWTRKDQQIRPQQYLYQRSGGKKTKYLRMDFDWAKKQVHIDDHKHPWVLNIKTATQDKLLYQLVLMDDLANHKKQFVYDIADGGKLKVYQINLLGPERITTPLGKIDTVKLIRHRNHPNHRETTLWCAPALGYLPVKLEHIEKDGTVFTALLHHLKGFDNQQAFTPSQTNSPASKSRHSIQ